MDKKMIWTHKIVGITLAVLVCAAACTTSTPSPQPTTTTKSPLPSPQPLQEAPKPESATFASVLPTPDPNWGTVTGRLAEAADGKPIVGLMAFLEQTTPEHNVPPVLYAPPNNQPRAKTNEDGTFIISEVPEGEYVVILFSPPFALQVVTESDGDTPMLINAQPGKVIDVGTVKVNEFQLP